MNFLRMIAILFPAKQYHHRSQGPVSIDPEFKGEVHVWGDLT